MAAARAAMRANKEARDEARAAGAPALEMRVLMDAGAPPELPGYGRACRMTAAMHQILAKWAKLPGL